MQTGLLPIALRAPSRHDNPFATCWTTPGALPFRFSEHQSTSELISKLAAQKWRGTILGPHGSGKSTLLEALKPGIVAAGRQVHSIALHDGQRRLPADFLDNAGDDPNAVLIIDGHEQLGWVARIQLWLRCRMKRAGLLITSHTRTRIPALIHLAPDRQLVEQLVDELCAEVSTTITRADIAASHACHGSNVREILFDLYDRHERVRRRSNSWPAAS